MHYTWFELYHINSHIFLTNIFPGDSLIIDTIIRVQKEKKAISIEKLNLSNPFFSYSNADVYISYFDHKKTEKYIILISNLYK